MRSAIRILTGCLATAIALAATTAKADTIPLNAASIGTPFTLDYNGFSDSTVIAGLTASTTFTLTGISGNNYTFDYSITNTTSSPLTSRLSGFGFNSNPDITAATSTGAFAYTTLDKNYPNGIGNVDVCFKDASTGSCAGGAGGGLATGTTGTGTFTLTFASLLDPITLGDFYVRYQSITGAGNVTSASGIGTISSSTSTSSGGTEVPEPGMLGLMGAGMLALGLMRRRRTARRPMLAYA